jgi:hypothetical protein
LVAVLVGGRLLLPAVLAVLVAEVTTQVLQPAHLLQIRVLAAAPALPVPAAAAAVPAVQAIMLLQVVTAASAALALYLR